MDKQIPILFANEQHTQRLTPVFLSYTQAITGDTSVPHHSLLEDFFLSGGFRICSGISSSEIYGRNAITYDRRKLGMIVHDISTNKFWGLINEPVPYPS